MRLTVLGGTGRIGRLIVEQALAAGDDVTVLVRDPRKLGQITERVRVVPGSVSDPAVMRTVIEAMRETGVRRIVNLSGAAVDAPGDRKPMIDRLASRIVRLVSGHVVGAKQAEFDELLASGLEWVAVRPPLVTDGPHTGRYRTGLDVLHPGARISRADIADFMLAQAAEPTFAQAAPFICYR